MKANTVFGQLGFWREGTIEQRQRVAKSLVGARERAERNRSSLMRHPDLADKFVKALGYERIDQWSGYCPPASYQGPFGMTLNTSPRRSIIVEILTEAASRDVAR
jgi:hypothetical protein